MVRIDLNVGPMKLWHVLTEHDFAMSLDLGVGLVIFVLWQCLEIGLNLNKL